MRIWLGRGFALLAALALLWLALSLSGLLPRLSAEQTEALDDMRAPPQQAQGERNAMELIWSLRYEVPVEQRAEVLREDSAALDAWRPEHGNVPTSVAEGRYPTREAADAPALPGCDLDCLQAVRSDPESWRAALAARASRLQALDDLADYDHLRTPFRPSLSMPLPAFLHTGELKVAEAALRFADGDAPAALQSLCRSSANWRALKGRGDSLIAEMVILAWLRRGAQLYAAMRAELRTDFPLPEVCTHAFAPLQTTSRMACDVFRSEFQMMDLTLQREMSSHAGIGGWFDRPAAWLLNREATAALLAPHYRTACRLLLRPIREWPSTPLEVHCPWQQRLFNPVGCVLADIALPHYLDYLKRERDLEGQLRLLALADHLASQPDPAGAFETRPEALMDFEQPIRFVDGELMLDLLQPRSNQTGSIPIALPGSRDAAGPGAAGDAADSLP